MFHFECNTYSLVAFISEPFPELCCTSSFIGILVFSSPIYWFHLLVDINVTCFLDWDLQNGRCEVKIRGKLCYLGCPLITIQVLILYWPCGFSILMHNLPHPKVHMLVTNIEILCLFPIFYTYLQWYEYLQNSSCFIILYFFPPYILGKHTWFISIGIFKVWAGLSIQGIKCI